jgi:glyoxylase-like metal-dependent hydrolase (beta-lactamase superfamily II)
MRNSSDEPASATAGLTYPFAAAPQPGYALSVAPGLMWLRMPLPFSGLDHINLWALEEASGWTLIDSGMQTPDTAAYWQQAFAGPLARRPATRVICTHMHPDHVGMAGWLTRQYDCRLWMTRLEYLTCRVLVADTGREAPADGLRFYHAAGWDADALAAYEARFGAFGKAVYTLPDSYRRIVDGEELLIGGRTWRAVIGRGHSPEHLCLHSAELRVLISGDQVLPRITSNVSVFPTEPEANPLQEWLESLASIAQRVPDDVLVLPAHNEPFHGLHARLAALINGHEQRLANMHEELSTPRRAIDVFGVLFRRRVGADMLIMATGESVAHLNCLIARKLAVRELDPAGIAWYRRA